MLGNNLSGKIAIVTGSSRGIGAAIASRLTQDGASVVVNYAATKGAIEQITRHLAKELGQQQITVNCVSPGPTNTPLFTEGKTPEQIEHFAQMASLGRLGEPADIARVVAFLASDEAGWISGQNIRVNGGFA